MNFGKALEAGLGAVRKMVPRFLGLARQLGLEIVGFLFLVFAAVFIFGPFGLIQAYRQLPDSLARLLAAAGGAVMFAWFGYDSFRRARKIARDR